MSVRSLVAFSLVLLLTLTSQAMAVARGANPATGQMVICVGGAAVTVHTDADGGPTSAPHICPDCTLQVVFSPVGLDGALSLGYSTIGPTCRSVTQHEPASDGWLPQTRAPPALV